MTAPMRLLRLPDVIGMTGLSRSGIYAQCANGAFPKPVKLSARSSAWVESEVTEWLATRVAERDGVRPS